MVRLVTEDRHPLEPGDKVYIRDSFKAKYSDFGDRIGKVERWDETATVVVRFGHVLATLPEAALEKIG